MMHGSSLRMECGGGQFYPAMNVGAARLRVENGAFGEPRLRWTCVVVSNVKLRSDIIVVSTRGVPPSEATA